MPHYQFNEMCYIMVHSKALEQRFQTGVPGRPLGVWDKIFGGPKCDFWDWEIYVLGCTFFSKEREFMKACKCFYSKQHYRTKWFQIKLLI